MGYWLCPVEYRVLAGEVDDIAGATPAKFALKLSPPDKFRNMGRNSAYRSV